MSSIGWILLIAYLLFVNIIAFLVFAWGAIYDVRPRDYSNIGTQMSIRRIFRNSYIGGGSLGAFIALLVFRNKRERDHHNILVPIMLVIHIALLVLFIIFQDKIFAA